MISPPNKLTLDLIKRDFKAGQAAAVAGNASNPYTMGTLANFAWAKGFVGSTLTPAQIHSAYAAKL